MNRSLRGVSGLIELIEPGEYRFVGSYWSQAVVPNVVPLEGYGEFVRDETSVIIAGAYRPGPGAQERGFEFVFPFAGMAPHACKVSVLLSGIERLKGAAFFRGGSLHALCRDGDLCASAHLRVEDSGAIVVSGLIGTPTAGFGYEVDARLPGMRDAVSNVVSLRGSVGR